MATKTKTKPKAKGKARKHAVARLPIPSRLSKTRAIRGLSFRAETVETYSQFVADKCSWMSWGPTQLSEASGVGYETCWRHMSKQVQEPRLTTCVAILQALSCDVKCLENPK